MDSAARLRVGLDLVEVAQVERALARFGARYVDRLFTVQEQADCAGPPALRARGLAARFAAKEAFVKVLDLTAARPPWTSIEVRRTESGAPELELHGAALELARSTGLGDIALSLTHEDHTAAAVVVVPVLPRHSEEMPGHAQ
jgi:holo-[acyl-carrier protein] synthase